MRTAQGVPVPGATLRLVELATGRAWVSWTDENGKFDLQGLPPGKYRIEMEQIGFEHASQEIELTATAASEAAQGELSAKPLELTLRVAPLDAILAANQGSESTTPPPTPASPDKNAAAKTEEAAAPTTPSQLQPPANGSSANSSKPDTAKRDSAQPGGQKKSGQQLPPELAERIRQRMQQQRGFQQVDLTGQGGNGGDTTPPPDTGPLGEASSSDAFLISGTVGRGAAAGSEGFPGFAVYGGVGGPGGGFGPDGVPGQPGGLGGPGQVGGMFGGGPFPGGPGGPRGGGPGRGQGKQGGGGEGEKGQKGGQRVAFGEGTEGLYGLQRVLRQQVNRIRVSFYERYGNSALDARPYSLTEVNPAKIPAWRERAGGGIGGPLTIPHVYNGKDKTFFFVNYNMARTRDPVDQFATVPTQDERAGNFCARGVQLFDPASNNFAAAPRASLGCSIDPSRLDKAAQGLLQFIPLPSPNLAGRVPNFHLQTRVPTAFDSFNARVIHTISPKLNLQAVYNFNETRTHSFSSFPGLESDTGSRGQSLMLGLTQNWTKRFIHDSRVFRTRQRLEGLNQFAFTQDIAGALGITGISTSPIDFGVPFISTTNFTDLNDPVPALRRNQTLRYVDSISYSLPKHTFRAGGEIRRMQINTRTDPQPRGVFTFTGLMTAQLKDICQPVTPTCPKPNFQPVPDTGFDFADFLLGLPQNTSQRFGSSSTYFRSWGFVAFAQDDWRIHPRFTLTLGLRYEAVTPPGELFGHIANIDVNPTFTQVATVIPGQTAPFSGNLPGSLVRPDYKDFSPRLGIAWKPALPWSNKHQTVVRAGYGMFYNESIYNQLAASMANQPPWADALSLQTGVNQVLTLEKGFPAQPQTTVRNTVAVDPNYRPGYAQIWNLSIETQLSHSWLLESTYTGTKGTHLDLLRAPNRAPPGSPLDTEKQRQIGNATGFTFDTFGATSIYNALQVRVQHRFARGLSLQGLYTYAKSIDDASSIGGGAPVVVQDDRNLAAERGLSSFDIHQQFRLNYVYELPFGERKRWARNGWQAAALGNWTISGYTTIQTGTPYTARALGIASDNTGTGGNASERADQVGNPTLPSSQRDPLHFFNTAAFIVPPPGRFGDAARNSIEGPGVFQINFALARRMHFGKDNARRLDLRWELANLTNTPNFTGLSTVVNSQTYGRVLGARGMRTMDFVMRVNF